MNIQKDSRIVEVFSNDLLKKDNSKGEIKDAHVYIQELASNPTPDNQYELAQILSFVINDGLTQRLNFLDLIADVKRTGLKEKAQFKLEIDGLKAMFQSKAGTTERTKVGNKYFGLDTEEVSIRPVVDFIDLKTGETNLVRLADQASRKLENAIVKRVQDVIYSAFKGLNGVNYATGAGITKGSFDPILFAMRRAGGQASIVGDPEALAGFTSLAGFNGTVPDALAVEHNQNGLIGRYNGSNLIQLDNPFQAHSLTETELRKDLIYVVPSVENNLKPIKVQLEGGVQTIGTGTNINSNQVEFRFDQWVGVGAVGIRKLLGVYEDSSLSE